MKKFLFILMVFSVISSGNLLAQDAAPAAGGGDMVAQLEPLIDKAMEGYNSGDYKVFYADFAKMMASITTEQVFATLYSDNYMKNFGKLKAKKLIRERCSFNDSAPLFVYEVECEKEKKVILSVNFIKEEDSFKIMQIQFNKE